MLDRWDDATDVVVLGYGGAGSTAAISAHDSGAKVIIVEKDQGGGNTRLATLTFLCPVKSIAAKLHMRALSFGSLDEQTIDAFVDWSSKNVDFVKELGGEAEVCPPGATFPNLPGSEAMIRYRVKGKQGELGGESLWHLLSDNVSRRKIPIYSRAVAKRLLRSGDEIIGVEIERGDKRFRVRAKRAVVLATGGFEYSDGMKREYFAGHPFYALGHNGNQGEGIKLAQDVGAELWHMRALTAPLGFKVPEYDAGFIMWMPAYGFIIVDQQGRRFCNETGLDKYSMWMKVARFDMGGLRFSRIPAYLIFDEKTRLSGPITRIPHGANHDFRWSADNSAEVERGWIASGHDPAELCRRLGLDPAHQLEQTLAAYNSACQAGRDEFGRSRETLITVNGTLYGIPVWPCLLNTQGGPKRNSNCQILDPWGDPIRRLYGAGELGSIWGFLYQSGGNLGECLGLGRLAGQCAALERP